jgi:DNA-binding NtrC family response regulator
MTEQENIGILILDDEKHFTEELYEYFRKSGFNAFEANTEKEATAILNTHNIDLLILDVRLQGINGLDILKAVKPRFPEMEVIVVSAHGDMDTVIKAMRLGAFDYLRKPFRHIDIQMAIERTQKYMQLHRKLKFIEERNSLISCSLEKTIDRQFIGVSPVIRNIFDQAILAAGYPDANVLITGESGTGKENIARIIHYSSDRKDHVFGAVNSSAITDSLLESEFFGHKKGSFTGAIADKMGYFEVCHQGTLFLDEVADMPLNLQAKILRATEEKVITRVGDTKKIQTDFRIISATNHDIYKLVDEKKFRLDLLHRLNTLHIHIPPLREHPEDIQPLLTHFIDFFSLKFKKPKPEIDKAVFSMLSGYSFPGNVRELKNLAERAVILSKGTVLGTNEFNLRSRNQESQSLPGESMNLNLNEQALIRKALQLTNFNQTSAASMLGITRDALIRKMRKGEIVIKKGD